jgi:uncharacterized protein (DUF169 family)
MTPRAEARVWCNYVFVSALDECTFDPDLLVCIADTYEAQLILRAASYISGDLWESKCSYVMSCAWTYVYPYISGKVNHLFTGMHLGLQLQNAYPPGLHILSIPYQKIGEVVTALAEMRREPLDMTEEVEKMRDDITIPIRID